MTAPTRAPYRPRHAAAAVAVPQRVPTAPEATPRLRVVAPGELSPRARRRRNRLIVFALSVFAVVGLFGVVAFHVVLTQGQLELDRLQKTATDQQSRYDRTRLLLAELEAPERIVAVAQERLGMVPPPEVTYLSPTGVKVDGSTRGRTTTRAATEEEQGTTTSWPSVKAHLAGR